MNPIRVASSIVAVALAGASCGGGDSTGPFPPDAFGIVASSDIAVGPAPDRLLVAISDQAGTRLASPDIAVRLRIFPIDREDDSVEISTEFVWAVPDVSGLYTASFAFESAGVWFVDVLDPGGAVIDQVGFSVLDDPLTPKVGEAAPPSNSVTLADNDLADITTDSDPDSSLYQMSISEAVTSGRPSVIVFATPRFCQTATCGPTLQAVRAMMPNFPGVNFVHVEVFTNLDEPGNLQVVPAVSEWGLPTEPWVFVVDANGVVTGRFEGVISEPDVASALS